MERKIKQPVRGRKAKAKIASKLTWREKEGEKRFDRKKNCKNHVMMNETDDKNNKK